jgi:hypothetical protein
LTDDEKIVITVLRDAVARGDGPLTVDHVQRLTWWPTRTGAGRELGRQRVSRALRSLTVRGLAVRTRPDVNHYRLDEQAWMAWGRGGDPACGGWLVSRRRSVNCSPRRERSVSDQIPQQLRCGLGGRLSRPGGGDQARPREQGTKALLDGRGGAVLARQAPEQRAGPM